MPTQNKIDQYLKEAREAFKKFLRRDKEIKKELEELRKEVDILKQKGNLDKLS
ncbi:MAG: hypothetical protein GF349_01100 [Candidatus Magasanikbacteria bacterium]|nr:hypothetical protein [Candidatus Magasanikbacteria bacterium]